MPTLCGVPALSILATCLVTGLAMGLAAQTPPPTAPPAAVTSTPPTAAPIAPPIAIVPLTSTNTVTGGLQVTGDKALIAASGSIASTTATTEVALPQRGALRVCAATTVKLAADASAPAGEIPGLMLALDHGAIETSFSTGSNADTVLTPDFRILIGGPAASHVKVRLGDHGDTCIDNPGPDAPYVLVTSVFDGSLYRVQSGQRVMLQHGSTHEVVDQEKEPCGCPPAQAEGNEFPLAQSAGLAPLPAPKPAAAPAADQGKPAVAAPPLVLNAAEPTQPAATPSEAAPASPTTPEAAPAASPAPQPPPKKPGVFARIGHFFHRLFGGE
ncbi:MAG TPA: hypothetical protein VE291_07535 [Terracidiphilus sp.]|jgi:hypothetical protein|nr:hypothetical protein [Terracidiphilus sp.]